MSLLSPSTLAVQQNPHFQPAQRGAFSTGLDTDRSRAADRRLRTLNRTLGRRTGQAKRPRRLTGEAGELVHCSVSEARRLARRLRARARGRGAQRKLRVAQRLEELADRAAKICRQVRRRPAGEQFTDRLVSIADPERPIPRARYAHRCSSATSSNSRRRRLQRRLSV
jgi:hypothetical protein